MNAVGHYGEVYWTLFNPHMYPSPVRPGPRFLPPSSLFSLLPILLTPHVQGHFIAFCVAVV